MMSGPVHDIFALDVYYHKKCYTNFVREKEIRTVSCDETQTSKSEQVKEEFLHLILKRIIQEKKAYFLTELMQDVEEMSSDSDLD